MHSMSVSPTVRSNDLWSLAATHLTDEEKGAIDFGQPDKLKTLADLHELTEKSKQDCIRKRWKYSRKSGETVILRDVFDKIIRWIDIFKQVGDVVIQYDPVHAALPWAAVRFLLQVCRTNMVKWKYIVLIPEQIAVNDHNKFGAVIEGAAWIAELIRKYEIVERLYLQSNSEAIRELEKTLVNFYTWILIYLSKAKRYLEKGSLG